MRGARMILCCAVWGLLCALPDKALAQMVIIPQERVQEAANPATIKNSPMRFTEGERVSFGTISEDAGEWNATIHWQSTQPLTITRIKTTCGCLGADWSRRAATNATSGDVEITFHPKGRIGGIEQRIFIYTTLSDDTPTAIVKIVGTVEPSTDHSTLYPILAGTLGLRAKSVRLPAEGGRVEIAVMNCGSEPLRVTHDGRLSLGGVGAYTSPAVLEAGEEGVLCIEYTPNGAPAMLYLAGVNTPPRERKIEIEIEK